MKPKIKAAAIKRSSGKVSSKKPPARHKDIGGKGERGFLTTSNKFVSRQKAKSITGKPKKGKRGTHSEDLW